MHRTALRLAAGVLFTAAALTPHRADAQYLAQIEGQFAAVSEELEARGLNAVPDMFNGALEEGATEQFTLSLRGGRYYQIIGVCDSDCSDVDLALFDASGTRVTEDVLEDDFPLLEVEPTSDGTYTVEVAMITCAAEPCYWGVQTYLEGEAPGGGPVGAGVSSGSAAGSADGTRHEVGVLSSEDETLGGGEYIDEYTFTGTAGQEVIVDLRSSDFDTYLIVSGPDGVQEDNDDHEGNVDRSLVRFELPASGEYRVGVTSYASGETGRYELDIRVGAPVAAMGPIVERGSLASGDETLRSGEFVDEYAFEAPPGQRVRVDLRSSDFDTYVMLLGPGDFREENDDADDDVGHSAIDATLADGGTYRVLVTSYAPDETGGYELTIGQGTTPTADDQRDVQRLEMGRSAMGSLADGDGELESGEYRDLWVFEGRAGQDVTVEITSDDFDTYLVLLSPDGAVLDENDDTDGRTDLSRVSARLGASGRYSVVATSYAAGETGSYDVTVRGAAAPTTDGSATRSSEGAGQIYGVFVGISDYGGRASDLAYTADDARRAAEAMVSGGGMSRDNAIVLTDRDATVSNVRAAFEEMGGRVGADDTFVVFYSGHGARVPRGGPEQSDPDALDETIELYDAAIRDNEMSDLLALIDSDLQLVVLDACFSGGFSKDVISVPGRMGFFSSEEDVTSQVAAKFRAGGYLAQFVFDGVGERLADGNGDGAISAIELSQYIHERYRSDVKSAGPDDYVRTGGPQTGFQHFVADRGSIGPDRVIFR